MPGGAAKIFEHLVGTPSFKVFLTYPALPAFRQVPPRNQPLDKWEFMAKQTYHPIIGEVIAQARNQML